jgi:hypothetical protein
MANLTASLQTEERGKRVLPGEVPEGGNLFGALAKVGASALGGMAAKDSRARANAEFAYKQGERAALNTTEQAVYDASMAATRELDKARAGANQGRVPTNTVDLKLEAKVGELYNQFPEYKSEIAKYMKAQGYDHFLFRDVDYAISDEKAMHDARVKADTDDIDYAVQHGVYSANKSNDENIAAGRDLRAKDERVKRLRDDAEEARKATSEGRTQYNFDQTRHDRDMLGAISDRTQSYINSMIDPLDALVASGLGDAGKEKKLAELAPVVGNAIDHLERQALADLGPTATEDMRKAVSDQFASLRKSASDRFAGSLSSYQTNKRAADNMANFFAIKNGESFALYSQLSSLMGRDAVNAIFKDNPGLAFSPEIQKQIKAEVTGYRTEDANSGRVHLSNLARLLSGQVGIKDMSEQDAMKQMPALAQVARGTGDAIVIGKDLTPSTYSAFANSYGNILNASVEIQSGQRDATPLWEGAKVLFAPRARAAMERMLTDPTQDETGMQLMMGSRGSAAHMLEVARDSQGAAGNKYISAKWNARTGQFEAIFDDRQFKKDAGKFTNSPSWNADKWREVGPQMKAKINTMNAAIEHLVQTSKYDPELAGLTPVQIRDHYANGTPIVKLGGKTVLSSDQEFDKALTDYSNALKAASITNSEGKAKAPPSSPISNITFTDDRDAAIRTAFIEAGNEPDDGIIAVLSTMINRQNGGKYGRSMRDVVLAPKQYTAWSDNPRKGVELSRDSKEYQRIGALYDKAMDGGYLPYDHYINFDLQAANGAPVPRWARGPSTKIGAHNFFTLDN